MAAPFGSHESLPFNNFAAIRRMEIRRIRNREVVLPRTSFHGQHRHIVRFRQESQFASPIGNLIGFPPEIPRNSPRDEEMIPPKHPLPLRFRRNQTQEIPSRRIPHRDARIPKVMADIEAGVERYINSRRHGRIVRQALVLLHIVVENHFQQKLIRLEPTIAGENPWRISDSRPEAGVRQIRTHIRFVGSSSERAAVFGQIGVESARNVLDEHVAAGATIGGEFEEGRVKR